MQNKTKQERCLFNVSKVDIVWFSKTKAEFICYYFEQVMKSFLVWNIKFIFLYQWLIGFLTRVLKSYTP